MYLIWRTTSFEFKCIFIYTTFVFQYRADDTLEGHEHSDLKTVSPDLQTEYPNLDAGSAEVETRSVESRRKKKLRKQARKGSKGWGKF